MTFAVNRPSRDASSRFIPAVWRQRGVRVRVHGNHRKRRITRGPRGCFEGHDFLRVLVIPNSTAHRLSTVIFDPTMPAPI